MNDLKHLIEQRDNTEVLIQEKLVELLEKSQYLKDKITKLNKKKTYGLLRSKHTGQVSKSKIYLFSF